MPDETQEPLPVRMLNEYAYCPRLFHLMHVEGRWADNAFTLDGKRVHRRVDQVEHVLPDPEPAGPDTDADATTGGDEPPEISRSVSLSSERLGLTAKLDLVQYSVFYCELNESERVVMEASLKEVINHADDQVLILDLGQGTAPLESALRTLGKNYVPPCRVQVV